MGFLFHRWEDIPRDSNFAMWSWANHIVDCHIMLCYFYSFVCFNFPLERAHFQIFQMHQLENNNSNKSLFYKTSSILKGRQKLEGVGIIVQDLAHSFFQIRFWLNICKVNELRKYSDQVSYTHPSFALLSKAKYEKLEEWLGSLLFSLAADTLLKRNSRSSQGDVHKCLEQNVACCEKGISPCHQQAVWSIKHLTPRWTDGALNLESWWGNIMFGG